MTAVGDGTVAEVVRLALDAVAIDDVMHAVAEVARHDRYQASLGIEAAAAVVADLAAAAGLHDIEIRRYPADGRPQWWSWRAPRSWTPTTARLETYGAALGETVVDHADQPFTIATYSAPTPAGLGLTRLAPWGGADPRGAVVLVDRSDFGRPGLPAAIAGAGAIGFVTDGPCVRTDPGGGQYPGRIELDPDSPIFAFSVTTATFDRLAHHAADGGRARVRVDVDRSASMPVVTGVLPGAGTDEEVWLTSHLCHPRAGANDNASGVAALLGTAAAYRALCRSATPRGPYRALRFVWGPEFLGTVAVVHDTLRGPRGRAGLPHAVVNLDMVGEDQAACGSPFVVEHPFDGRASTVGPLVERVVAEVFAATASEPGTWQATPFFGFSDHTVFADPSIGCPAVQLCHVGDRFNHTAADTLDKVSPVEMRRSTAAATAAAYLLATQATTPSEPAPALADSRVPVEATDPAPPVERLWAGPVNVRAMVGDLPAGTAAEVAALFRADKRNYSLLLNFALRIDGRRSLPDIVYDTAAAAGRPIEPAVADRLCAALLESGWARLAG